MRMQNKDQYCTLLIQIILFPSMQHLLRLLTIPLNSQEDHALPLPAFREASSQRKAFALSSADAPLHQRRNCSMQHRSGQRQNKALLGVTGTSQSQRIACSFSGKEKSVRISKNTYRIHNHPTVKSEPRLENTLCYSQMQSGGGGQGGTRRLATISLHPDLQEQQQLFSRKRNCRGKRQLPEENGRREGRPAERKRRHSKKGNMLRLVGEGCKIFQPNTIFSKRPNQDKQLRSLQL